MLNLDDAPAFIVRDEEIARSVDRYVLRAKHRRAVDESVDGGWGAAIGRDLDDLTGEKIRDIEIACRVYSDTDDTIQKAWPLGAGAMAVGVPPPGGTSTTRLLR